MKRKRGQRRPKRITIRADLKALKALSARSISRKAIQHAGYLPVCASSDLFAHGYSVRHWWRVRDRHELLEYNPRLSDLPRVTAGSYAEQAAIHRALRINLVPPGVQWTDYGQAGLFDSSLAEGA